MRARKHLSPKEIVEDAKAAGIKLDAGYVYNVRATDENARKKKRDSKATTTSNLTRPSSPVDTNEEELLKLVAAEVGLGRAMETLAGEGARVRAVLRG